MSSGFVATVTSKLDPMNGIEGANATPPLGIGIVVAPGAPTVRAEGLPVATVGTMTSEHGNPYWPKLPGFNPVCASSIIVEGIMNVLVEGKPIAFAAGPKDGSLTTCGHWVFVSPCKTVVVSGPLGG
jgi:uncharacterized Zn-binding protein involved in type VI secretion